MICKYCNSEIQEEMKFCPNCGKTVENDLETNSENNIESFTGVVEDKASDSSDYQRFTADDLRSKTSKMKKDVKSGKSNNALISFMTGVASLVCCCLGGLSVTLGIIAIIFGIISISSEEENHGLAVAGMICGAIGGIIGICIIAVAGVITFVNSFLNTIGGI